MKMEEWDRKRDAPDEIIILLVSTACQKKKREKKKSQKTPNHIDKQATDLARGNQEKSNRADFIMFP